MRKWILTGAALVFAVLLGIAIWQLDFPNWQHLNLDRIRTIPESTQLFDASGNAIGALGTAHHREYVELSRIPEHVRSAFIAAEDQRFYEHSGVDLRRIVAALWHDIKTLSFEQGASTITQQLIKLTHLTSEKTLSRKAQEIVLARQLERRMEKDEILEAYLNTVYFGNGAHGIGAAAQAYFGKDTEELTIAEGALLAGIIKSPSNYAPHLKPENSIRRRNLILDAMLDCGFIDEQSAALAREEPLRLQANSQQKNLSGWYADLVLDEAQKLLQQDAEDLLSGGYHIYTAYNPVLQAGADKLFENGANFPDPAQDGTPVQAALIALDNSSGEICAVVGGREYEVQRGLNRATQIQRQPGSAIKPISTYAAAIENYDFLPTSMAQDIQREFSGKYLPGNAGGSYYGTVTLREALSRSLNVATVDIAELIGVQSLRRSLAAFGVPLSVQDVNLALALGSMTNGVSPARLAAAYCALANGGTQVEPHCIRRITNANGRVLYEAKPTGERAVSAQTAFLVCDMLKTAASEGSAKALSAAGIPVAGKTGTVGEAGGGNRDIWTVANTPELTVSVWMGFDEPDGAHAIPDSAGGSSYPARLCAAYLHAVRSQLSGADFEAPAGLVPLKIDKIALQETDSVLLAAPNTPDAYVQLEWFPEDRRPTESSSYWNAPEMVDDLKLLSEPGEAPALAFTSKNDSAEYLILRRTAENTELAAVLSAEAGNVIVWSDPDADLSQKHSYSVLPRHHLLYESGTQLTGLESASVEYRPANLFERIFG